jgi:DNA primase small subunit
MGKLRAFLIEQKPLHVYFSVAKYKDPGNIIMAEKGWIGADLIFDIDYDALKEPTLGEAAYQVEVLSGILKDKFALKDLTMAFSGSRGYHIHVRDDCIQSLDRNERGQIAEYVMAKGIEIDAPVTCDLSRLIRLPGSIHGKTMQECRVLQVA